MRSHGSHEVRTFFGKRRDACEIDASIGCGLDDRERFAVAYCTGCGSAFNYRAERGDSGEYSIGMAFLKFRRLDPSCQKVSRMELVGRIMEN
jgi:hypothetical protein